jgi:hypothetical protein
MVEKTDHDDLSAGSAEETLQQAGLLFENINYPTASKLKLPYADWRGHLAYEVTSFRQPRSPNQFFAECLEIGCRKALAPKTAGT